MARRLRIRLVRTRTSKGSISRVVKSDPGRCVGDVKRSVDASCHRVTKLIPLVILLLNTCVDVNPTVRKGFSLSGNAL